MIIKTDQYKIDHSDDTKVVLSGKMRLASPMAYDGPFRFIKSAIEKSDTYTIDIKTLEFLNSSGINSIARLVFVARKAECILTIEVSKDVPWQEKTLVSLEKLYSKLIIKEK